MPPFSLSWGYKNWLLACKRSCLSLELACCSNSVSHSNKFYSPFILPHVWKFSSNTHTDHGNLSWGLTAMIGFIRTLHLLLSLSLSLQPVGAERLNSGALTSDAEFLIFSSNLDGLSPCLPDVCFLLVSCAPHEGVLPAWSEPTLPTLVSSPQSIKSVVELKCTVWKLWVKFYFGQNEDCSLGESVSDSPENLLWGGQGELAYIGILQQKASSWEHQKWLLIKDIVYVKLRNLVLFCVWEDARVWTHWNHSFDMCFSYLGPESHIFISSVSSGLALESGYSLIAAINRGRYSFLHEFLQGSPAHHSRWLQSLMTVTSFVYWYGRKYSMCLCAWGFLEMWLPDKE